MPNQLSELTVPEHFYRPSNSNNWYVRLVAPTHLLHVVKDKEFRKSTGHADLKRAKPKGMALIAEQFRVWDSIARTLPDTKIVSTILTSELIETICASRLYSWLRSDDEERNDDKGLSLEEIAEINDFCKLTDEVMRRVTIQGKGSPRWSEVVTATQDWCLTLGYGVEVEDPLFPILVRKFAKVEQEAQKNIELRNQGEGTETPTAFPMGQSLSAITEIFETHKNNSAGTAHVGAMLNAWSLFIEHCGDIAFDRITSAHIFNFLQARMRAPKKPWSANRARTFGLRTLREIFGLARATISSDGSNSVMMTISNPADSLEAFPGQKDAEEALHKNPRHPFTAIQLNTLLWSAWYNPAEQVQFTGKMKHDLGARYWVPLIGTCHGNRVGEGVQLVVSDFSFSGDLFVMSFQTELDKSADDPKDSQTSQETPGRTLSDADLERLRHLKNISTKRVVPVHPILLELGFVEFVEKRRKESGSNGLLFPSSEPRPGGKRPKLGRAYEQAFLRFVRDKLGFGSGFGNHSFRHLLEDRIRNSHTPGAAWPAGLSQQYVGRKRTRALDRDVIHDEGSEGAYGNGYLPSTMLRFINTVDFSDVKLPLPYGKWLMTKGPDTHNKKINMQAELTKKSSK